MTRRSKSKYEGLMHFQHHHRPRSWATRVPLAQRHILKFCITETAKQRAMISPVYDCSRKFHGKDTTAAPVTAPCTNRKLRLDLCALSCTDWWGHCWAPMPWSSIQCSALDLLTWFLTLLYRTLSGFLARVCGLPECWCVSGLIYLTAPPHFYMRDSSEVGF